MCVRFIYVFSVYIYTTGNGAPLSVYDTYCDCDNGAVLTLHCSGITMRISFLSPAGSAAQIKTETEAAQHRSR
jgi:hypothetical protein